jgi:hypothetical protein
MAALLALLLLSAATISADRSLHQLLHGDSSASHFCLVCSFSTGQLDLAETGQILAVFVFSLVLGIRLVPAPVLQSFDYRLSPSRAPPPR